MSNYTYLSQEGFDSLSAQLDKMKTVDRAAISRDIAEAREKGDLSENAEYHAAKDAQGLLEARINKLDKTFANARVLDPSMLDASKVTVLSTVKIKNKKNGKEVSYKLVAHAEADLKAKKLSVSSPIGEGLLGKAVGDIATVQTPNGQLEFEIVDIALL